MIRILRYNKILFTLLFFLMFTSMNSHALDNYTINTEEPPKIVITSGKSAVIKIEEKIKRVSIGSTEIADYQMLSPTEIYIKGKAAGITNMILWKKDSVSTIFDIEVKYDLSRLKEKLYQILPDEKEIRVMATNHSLTLSGRVSSAGNLSQALSLAKSYAPKGKVNNLLTVGGTHQVMLEVKISEMSRSLGRELGIGLGVQSENGNLALQLLSDFGTATTPAFSGLLQYLSGDTEWLMDINAVKANGLLKILAEPNLIALSGQTASFLAGGEFPIPVPNEDGITVEFKDFGVGLSFTPNVLSENKINIKVSTSVSELDFTTAVQFEGYVVPGISSRKATTTIELADGQSFVMAGLLSEAIRENVEKFPFLGDLPFLGTLFRSSSFKKNETELVIIVTPRFVKPMNKEIHSVPSDFYEEPDDTEFYFNIDRPSEKLSQNSSSNVNMDGQFGHSFEE